MSRYVCYADFGDGVKHHMFEYPTFKEAKGAINWQGQPRGDIDWLDDKTAITISFGGRSTYETLWTIEESTQ